MLRRLFVALSLFAALSVPGALAVDPGEALDDPALEARARALSAGLRCMVCQNQSIDDSDAPLARDLRLLVRERLKAGDSDDEAIDYIVERYGSFVLLKPPFSPSTLLLWLAPLLLVAAGAAYLWRARRPEPENAFEALSPDEKRRLDKILES
jgi:cytochrome c-type biogenesis protein CcmH